MTQAIFTASLTVITGTLVYVLGRIIEKFLIEPIHQQREVIGKISEHLIYASRLFANPYNLDMEQIGMAGNKDEWIKAGDKTRELSALLNAKSQSIPFYNFLSKLRIVIPKKEIKEVTSNLIGLSNSYFCRNESFDLGLRNSERVDRVNAMLKINV